MPTRKRNRKPCASGSTSSDPVRVFGIRTRRIWWRPPGPLPHRPRAGGKAAGPGLAWSLPQCVAARAPLASLIRNRTAPASMTAYQGYVLGFAWRDAVRIEPLHHRHVGQTQGHREGNPQVAEHLAGPIRSAPIPRVGGNHWPGGIHHLAGVFRSPTWHVGYSPTTDSCLRASVSAVSMRFRPFDLAR